MADLILTTDFTQLNNMNNALNETANTVERRVNPVLQRLQENLQFQERVNQQLTQSNQVLARSFTMNEIQQAANRIQNYEQALAHSREGMNSFGVVVQQAGYQVGDFLVQVQSGTNWMVAFGQQATQLVGVLPMMTGFMGLSTGALVALSAGLGIAIPLVTAIGAAYMRMGESANSAASSVMTLTKAQEQLNQASADYALKLEMLRFGVDTQAEAFALREIYDLTAQIQRLNREYQQTDSLSRRQAIAEEVLGLKEQLSIQQGIVDEVNSKRQAYETALAINKQMQAVELAHARAIGDARREQEAMTEAAQDALGKYSMMRTVAAGIANEMARAAANTRAAAEAALSAMKIEFSPAGQAMGQYAGRGATSNQPVTMGTGEVVDFSTPVTAGSGGGGGGSGGNARLDALINQLQTEREVLEEWYATSQDTLMLASESELAILGGYNEAKLRLEQEYQDRLKNIRDESNNTALTDAANFFGGLAAVTENGGERLVKATQTFAAIEALINTYRAQAQVLADPTLGFFGKAAAYLQIGAAGLNVVRAIKGVSGGGSGSAGSARGSATVAPTASAPTPQTVMIDSIDPDSLYSGQSLINLFEAFYDENDRRGKVFVVAR